MTSCVAAEPLTSDSVQKAKRGWDWLTQRHIKIQRASKTPPLEWHLKNRSNSSAVMPIVRFSFLYWSIPVHLRRSEQDWRHTRALVKVRQYLTQIKRHISDVWLEWIWSTHVAPGRSRKAAEQPTFFHRAANEPKCSAGAKGMVSLLRARVSMQTKMQALASRYFKLLM